MTNDELVDHIFEAAAGRLKELKEALIGTDRDLADVPLVPASGWFVTMWALEDEEPLTERVVGFGILGAITGGEFNRVQYAPQSGNPGTYQAYRLWHEKDTTRDRVVARMQAARKLHIEASKQ